MKLNVISWAMVIALSAWIFALRSENRSREIEAESLKEQLNGAFTINKANDEATRKLIAGYEAQVSEFAAALLSEREKHNETRKLIARIESRDIGIDSRRSANECAIATSGDPILDGLNAN
jgi:hypothetical protein